jgi:hypothetical protein
MIFAPQKQRCENQDAMPWPLLACCALVQAAGAAPPLEDLKRKLLEELAAVPNYTCTETIERSHRASRKHRFKLDDRVRLEIAVVEGREVFGWPGGEKIAEADITRLVPGFIGSGDFLSQVRRVLTSSATTFTPAGSAARNGRAVLRYDYRVPKHASGWSLRTPAAASPDSSVLEVVVGYSGSLWVDGQSLDLLELTISADDLPPWLEISSLLRTVFYRRVGIGASNYVLPGRTEMLTAAASGEAWKNLGRFEDCRQYTAESVLRFDVPEESTSAGVSRASPPPGILPPEFEAELSLETPIDSGSAAAGDVITARLLNAITLEGHPVVPRGSLFLGRIAQLGLGSGTPYVNLKFTSINGNGARIDLSARRNTLIHFGTSRIAGLIIGGGGRLHLRRGFKLILRSSAN